MPYIGELQLLALLKILGCQRNEKEKGNWNSTLKHLGGLEEKGGKSKSWSFCFLERAFQCTLMSQMIEMCYRLNHRQHWSWFIVSVYFIAVSWILFSGSECLWPRLRPNPYLPLLPPTAFSMSYYVSGPLKTAEAPNYALLLTKKCSNIQHNAILLTF